MTIRLSSSPLPSSTRISLCPNLRGRGASKSKGNPGRPHDLGEFEIETGLSKEEMNDWVNESCRSYREIRTIRTPPDMDEATRPPPQLRSQCNRAIGHPYHEAQAEARFLHDRSLP